MSTNIPSADEVRSALQTLRYGQVERLSDVSGVPVTTLWKVRQGDTENPGIETVRKFYPHIAGIAAEPAAAGN